jgi:hypothetical protein
MRKPGVGSLVGNKNALALWTGQRVKQHSNARLRFMADAAKPV